MAQHVIYVTRRIHEDVRRHLERFGSVVLWEEDRPIPQAELVKAVQLADALLCMPGDRITREVIEAGERLRVISTISVRYDHIDLRAAARRHIIVSHTPGAADDAVADMTMALLLACARRIIDAHGYVKARKWRSWHPELFLGSDIQGSAIGIIGLGRVGIRVAHRALGFAMRVFYYDPQRNEDAEQLIGIQYGSLDNVLREADYITLHMPYSAATHGLINAARLHLMKPNAYLINMAHGAVVEREALLQALREGWIAGAGLDVYQEEPLPLEDPLLDLPNVVVTPHIGANTEHAFHRMIWMAVEQLLQVLHGGSAAHPVPQPPDEGREAA